MGGHLGGYQPEFYPHQKLTEAIIGAAFLVHNRIGPSFVEKVYENALAVELRRIGHTAEQQRPLDVKYGGKPVGHFIVDILVDGKVIVEVKAVSEILHAHEEKLIHYLKASGIEVGLLLNFSRSVQIKRKIFSQPSGSA